MNLAGRVEIMGQIENAYRTETIWESSQYTGVKYYRNIRWDVRICICLS
jgi:hypothetical protein